MPTWWFTALVGLLAALRIGPSGVGPNFLRGQEEASAAWPTAVNTMQSSPGVVLLFRALGAPSAPVWWFVGSVVWLATWATVLFLLARTGAWGRIAAVALAASPAFAVTLSILGHYDMLLILGSFLVVLARSRALAIVGAVIATSGNVEQALVAALAYTIVGFATRNREGMVRGAGWLVLAAAASAAAALVVPTSPDLVSRASALGDGGIGFGVRLFLAAWPLATYAFLGPLWAPTLLRVLDAPTRWRGILLAIGVILLPAAASIATLDGTRVFVMTGFAALLLAAKTWDPRGEPPRWALAACLAALVLMPAIVTMPEPSGLVRLPWSELVTVLGWPIDWELRR